MKVNRRFINVLNVAIGTFLCEGSERLDGRYSFSLTTFSPSGKLSQVDRAMEAAGLGTPIVALCRRNQSGDCSILMASPQALPSPLIKDDGTARFSRVTPRIAVAHSGLSADGRVVVAAAQRMAVEHAYTFDESIPIELFLEEVSLLFQEYTMKAASRPFGVTLLVGYLPLDDNEEADMPQLYRIYPSGAVESLGSFGVIGSSSLAADIIAPLRALASRVNSSLDEDRATLVDLLKKTISKKTKEAASSFDVLTAKITQTHGLVVERYKGLS
jgi:20S proteasome alpha/beta subunit